jgi:hypothetical protein
MRVGGTQQMRADVYPATVQFSFGTHRYSRARAMVTTDRVIVLVEAGIGPSGVGVLYDGRLEDVSGDRNQLTATTADGEVTIFRQSGCGCGSKLRSYRPYGRMVAMATASR